MKKPLLLLFCGGILIVGCTKEEVQKVIPNLTFDDIKGTYTGSIYEDLPLPTGGVTSELHNDTVTIKMEGSTIVVTSPVMGRLVVTAGTATDTTFELIVPEQQTGKKTSTGIPQLTGKDGSKVTIGAKSNTKKLPTYFFNKDTLGKDPNESPIGVMTRYRVVSLEK